MRRASVARQSGQRRMTSSSRKRHWTLSSEMYACKRRHFQLQMRDRRLLSHGHLSTVVSSLSSRNSSKFHCGSMKRPTTDCVLAPWETPSISSLHTCLHPVTHLGRPNQRSRPNEALPSGSRSCFAANLYADFCLPRPTSLCFLGSTWYEYMLRLSSPSSMALSSLKSAGP